MAGAVMQRRLAAILVADVAGYSRLMHADDEGTLRTLAACRGLIEERVVEHQGRVFARAGDNLIAEFPSVVSAVRSAVRIQHALARYNQMLPAERRMPFRIGIHLGEVIVEGDNLFGDGVNIAARLEALAEPGGILLSGAAYDQIEGKFGQPFVFLGERQLRNLDQPVRLYRYGGKGAPKPPASPAARGAPGRRVGLAAAAALALVVAAAGLWYAAAPRPPPDATIAEAPSPELPATPSIAVLPFAVPEGEAELARFAGGLADSLVTELARFPELLVIGRGATEAYREASADPRRIGRELGVRLVLDGSLERADDRLMLHAQLVDASTGYMVWAERYERPWRDFLSVQDDLTATIVGTLGGWDSEIARVERQRLRDKPTESLEAYDFVLQAAEYYERFTEADNRRARAAALEAIARDPTYALAHAYLAWTHMAEFWWAWTDRPESSAALALEWARRAVAHDPHEYNAHWALGDAYQALGDFERAHAAYERALALNPNDPELLQDYGSWILPMAGRAEDGIAYTERAMRLNPRHPERYLGNLAFNYLMVGRYQDAARAVARMGSPRVDHRITAAIAHAELGDAAAAARELGHVLEERPDLTVERFLDTLPFQNGTDRERFRALLVKAGLPE